MATRFLPSMIVVAVVAAAVGAVGTMAVMRTQGQAQAQSATATPPLVDGKPNFSGIWQANNEANWDLQAHAARPAAVTQQGIYPYDYARVPAAPVLALGAAGAVPGSLGVVQGDGEIPYKQEALARKQENAANWIDRDPELKCYLPGLPRAMYLPHPFQITQSTNKIHIAYSFTNTARTIHLDEVDGPPDDAWMGHSVGRWEGDTLVVNVTNFNDRSWFDRAGNYHSAALRLTERFTLKSPDVIWYEVTIEDPNVFTRPWTIAMPIYRRAEPNMQLLEFRCNEFVEEFMYGSLRKEQLVRRWDGEMMSVEITRKIPEGDRFYEWYSK
jgi:hypothetical protein